MNSVCPSEYVTRTPVTAEQFVVITMRREYQKEGIIPRIFLRFPVSLAFQVFCGRCGWSRTTDMQLMRLPL